MQAAPLGELKYDEVDLARGPARLGLGASASFNSHPTYDNAGAVADADTILRAGGDLRFAVAGEGG